MHLNKMNNKKRWLIFIIFTPFLNACSEQIDATQRFLNAYEEGYEWARAHAPLSKSQCMANRYMSIYERLISNGCLKYLERHPEAEVLIFADDSSLDEDSSIDDSEMRPAPAADDFEWGYEWAQKENVTNIYVCAQTDRSETYVAGCQQYVQDLIDSEQNG